MAIETPPAATPLRAQEPVLIVFVLIAIVGNFTFALVTEKLGYATWLSVAHSGFFFGQCLVAMMLAGLMGRSWLGAFGIVLAAITLCFHAAMFLDWWRSGFASLEPFVMSSVFPLALLIAAVPSMALRQLAGLRIATESSVLWSRSTLSLGDIFVAVAFAAAMLASARVGMLSNQDRTEFWISVSVMSLVGFGMGMLIVIPAVWCVFVFSSRRAVGLGLGCLLMVPSAICLVVLAFISSDVLSVEEKVQGLGFCALASVAAAAYFVPLLLLLYRRGYRLLRVPIAAADDPPVRYRHASRWIVGALVAVAAIVNFWIAPIEETQQRKRQFEQWVRSLSGSVVKEGDETWVLDLSKGQVSDDDLKYLRSAPSIIRLDLSGTDITDAGLEYVGLLTSLESLTLNDTAVTDRGLQQIRHLPKLQSLSLQKTGVSGSAFMEFESRRKIVSVDLQGADVTDEGCRGIGELKALQNLSLAGTSITDAGLRHLGGLTRLQRLFLVDTVFDGIGFEDFEEMPDLAVVSISAGRCGDGVSQLVLRATRLRELYLDRTRVTDAMMSALRGNSTICELDLTGTAITDDGLRTLHSLKSLVKLQLGGTSVAGPGFRHLDARRLETLLLVDTLLSDDCLAHLKRFPRLHSLFLKDTPIGDRGLSHLAGRQFYELHVGGTQVTAKGLLDAYIDAAELTIDDSQANDTERAALEAVYPSVIVVPKSNEVESE